MSHESGQGLHQCGNVGGLCCSRRNHQDRLLGCQQNMPSHDLVFGMAVLKLQSPRLLAGEGLSLGVVFLREPLRFGY